MRAQLIVRFVSRKRARRCSRALSENAAGRADVNRVEIIPIFNFRAIGVAQFLVEILLLGQRLIIGNFERDMVARAGAETPAAGGPVRFVNENESLGRSAGSNLEAMIVAVLTGLAESERV